MVGYSRVENENYEGLRVPADCPTDGRLDVSDLAVHHAIPRPFSARSVLWFREFLRMGVVGCTDAGGSSLVQAFFRIL